MQTDKILSAELLEKYQQGKLQPEEMQQVEKAMLQNPFLTETVEGIALSKNSFAEEVENLKKQMPYYIENHKENHKKNNKGKLFKSSNHQEIYRLAAVILLLLTTGFMLWFFSKSSQEKSTNMSYEIAQKEHNLSENSPASPQATTADLQEKMPEKLTSEVSKPIIKPTNKEDKQPIQVSENEREEAPILHDKIIAQNDDNQEVTTEKLANKPMNESTSTMPDLNHSLAKINSRKEQVESKKQAKIISKDSNTDNSASNARANAEISSEEDLKKSADKNMADDEIVNMQAEKSKAKKTAENASPEMGWEKYQNYLNTNLNRKVADSKKGKVIAEIAIDEKGIITDVRILQSLCELCDEEVKRLLFAGGKWKVQSIKKSEKIEIIVIF